MFCVVYLVERLYGCVDLFVRNFFIKSENKVIGARIVFSGDDKRVELRVFIVSLCFER